MKVEKEANHIKLKPLAVKICKSSDFNNSDKVVQSSLNDKDNVKISLHSLLQPDVLFSHELEHNEETKPRGKKITDGVWYDNTMKTKEGAEIRLLTAAPLKVNICVEFNENGKSVSPSAFKNDKNFIAAINGQFFAPSGTIGDMETNNKVFEDEKISHNYDSVSDKRYYIGITKDNKMETGKGGLEESGGKEHFKMFFGGMALLYNKEQSETLKQDIESGELKKRINYSGSCYTDTISRSFLGITKDGKLLLLTAGEGQNRAKGLDFTEAAYLMKKLGATESYVLDGGGSTSMLVRGEKPANTDGRVVKSYISIRHS